MVRYGHRSKTEGEMTYHRLGTNVMSSVVVVVVLFTSQQYPAMSSVLSWFIFNILSLIHSATSSIVFQTMDKKLGSLREYST